MANTFLPLKFMIVQIIADEEKEHLCLTISRGELFKILHEPWTNLHKDETYCMERIYVLLKHIKSPPKSENRFLWKSSFFYYSITRKNALPDMTRISILVVIFSFSRDNSMIFYYYFDNTRFIDQQRKFIFFYWLGAVLPHPTPRGRKEIPLNPLVMWLKNFQTGYS